jgi:hypothetical protein
MPAKSKYDDKLHPPLIRWMARAGLVDQEICGKLGICKHTLYAWAKRYPDVAEALKESRDFIDSLVEGALLKRALGFDVEESKVFGVRNKKGIIVERMEKAKKHFAPDTTACIFWLKNRRRPQKGLDLRLAWQDVSRVEVEPPGLDAPLVELSNYELDSKIAKLERALGGIPGEAPPAKCGDKPDTVH